MDGDTGALGQAGYAITGSGGGGAGGQYVFASLAELDGLITDWEALRDRIRDRDVKFRRAISLIAPPADDLMSRLQAKGVVGSLVKAQAHNLAMFTYADGYVTKLKAAHAQYAAIDADNAALIRRSGQG
ncbi:MAG: hypothetical protein ACJ72N_15250 [Labedaea sp.]